MNFYNLQIDVPCENGIYQCNKPGKTDTGYKYEQLAARGATTQKKRGIMETNSNNIQRSLSARGVGGGEGAFSDAFVVYCA